MEVLKNISKVNLRINTAIKAKEVRLINGSGEQKGIVPIDEAIQIAESESMDLVEVNPNSNPPVCRIIDYGKFKYKQDKKEKESKKKQHVVKVKEIKVRPSIDSHDLNIKLENAKKFLESACKVKLTLMFRGREVAHKEIGENLLERISSEVISEGLGTIEAEPKFAGRTLSMVIAPTKTK